MPATQKKTAPAKFKKVAIVNFSGNVGKSTIAKELLAPRMNAPEFTIESSNANAAHSATQARRYDASNYEDLQSDLIGLDSAIVDIGASNAQEFIRLMGIFKASHEEFDVFLIPVVSEKKQQTDTINTIEALASLGVPAERILLVYNRVEMGKEKEIDRNFSLINGYFEIEKKFTILPEAVIFRNDIYDRLRVLKMSIMQITNDTTDYRKVINEGNVSEAEKKKAINMVLAKRLAGTALDNLDAVYNVLFG